MEQINSEERIIDYWVPFRSESGEMKWKMEFKKVKQFSTMVRVSLNYSFMYTTYGLLQDIEWQEYEDVNRHSRGVRFPTKFRFVEHIWKSEWMKMTREEKRKAFEESTIHVINDDEKTDFPVKSFTADELHAILDIYEARYCHGKMMFFLFVKTKLTWTSEDLTKIRENGLNDSLLRATLDDFLTQRESENRTVLNFLDLPLMHSSISLPIG